MKKHVTLLLATIIALNLSINAFAYEDSTSSLFGSSPKQYSNYIENTNNSVNSVAPDYFNISADGNLIFKKIDYNFVNKMHDENIKVIPFISNYWDKALGVAALNNCEVLTTQIANQIYVNNLDGVNIDIENLSDTHKDAYTNFVKVLRKKIPDKTISVSVAANPNSWQTGWHGSYDYKGLSEASDYLLLMAYDESYFGSPKGPVASSTFVEKSIIYALNQTSPDKIVLGIPFFGRYWKSGETTGGRAISSMDVETLLNNYPTSSSKDYDPNSKSAQVLLTLKDSDIMPKLWGGAVLTPGKYEIWYDDINSTRFKLGLVEKYKLRGSASWALNKNNMDAKSEKVSYKNNFGIPAEDTNVTDSRDNTNNNNIGSNSDMNNTINSDMNSDTNNTTNSDMNSDTNNTINSDMNSDMNNTTNSDMNSDTNNTTSSDMNSDTNNTTNSDINSDTNNTTSSDMNSDTNNTTSSDMNSDTNNTTNSDMNSDTNNTTNSDMNSDTNNTTSSDMNSDITDNNTVPDSYNNTTENRIFRHMATSNTDNLSNIATNKPYDTLNKTNYDPQNNFSTSMGNIDNTTVSNRISNASPTDISKELQNNNTPTPNVLGVNATSTSNALSRSTNDSLNNNSINTTVPLNNSPRNTTAPLNNSPTTTTVPLNNNPTTTTAPLNNNSINTTVPLNNSPRNTTAPLNNSPTTTTAPLNNSPTTTTAPLNNSPTTTTAPLNNSPTTTTGSLNNNPTTTTGSLNNNPTTTTGSLNNNPTTTSVIPNNSNINNSDTLNSKPKNSPSILRNDTKNSNLNTNIPENTSGITDNIKDSRNIENTNENPNNTAVDVGLETKTINNTSGNKVSRTWTSEESYDENNSLIRTEIIKIEINQEPINTENEPSPEPINTENEPNPENKKIIQKEEPIYEEKEITTKENNNTDLEYDSNYSTDKTSTDTIYNERNLRNKDSNNTNNYYKSLPVLSDNGAIDKNLYANNSNDNSKTISNSENELFEAEAKILNNGWFSHDEYERNKYLTRAEAIKIIMRMANVLDKTPIDIDNFNDVIDNKDKEFIIKAKYYGIIKGDENDNFKPSENIKKEDLVLYMERVFNLPDTVNFENPKITDVFKDKNSEIYYAINKFYDHGIIELDKQGNFHPNFFLTMGEMTKIANRLDGAGVKDLKPTHSIY